MISKSPDIKNDKNISQALDRVLQKVDAMKKKEKLIDKQEIKQIMRNINKLKS